ncbi:hypothetical protein AB9K34_20065 [Sedimentitalea sp. XS_ASV28]|uniref:hypothetical protein n=1 Tax=Sedimentitalea sp. XS_ASV28 TaxID=3241296 RepID=UPI003519D697
MGIFNDPKVTGAGGALIGLLLGLFIGNDTLDEDVRTLVREEIAPVSAAAREQGSVLEAMSARLDALDAAVADGAAATGDLVSAVGEKIEGLRDTLGGKISETAASQADSLKTTLAEMSASLESWTRSAVDRVALEGGAVAGPGEVLMLADGALRVFVSGVVNGKARLAVNGLSTQVVAVGDSVTTDVDGKSCTVSVAAIRENRVGLTGDCG